MLSCCILLSLNFVSQKVLYYRRRLLAVGLLFNMTSFSFNLNFQILLKECFQGCRQYRYIVSIYTEKRLILGLTRIMQPFQQSRVSNVPFHQSTEIKDTKTSHQLELSQGAC